MIVKQMQRYQEEFVRLGNIDQYLLHYPQQTNKPVILFLHGGPGNAESNLGYFFDQYWPDCYQVVYWDQRGAGKTLKHHQSSKEYPDFTKIMAELDQLVEYLKDKYQQDQLILLGHSWGTVLGSLYALRKPGNISMYIAVGQVVSFRENEELGLAKVIEVARQAGNEKDVEWLRSLTNYPPRKGDKEGMKLLTKVRKYQMKYKLAATFSWALIKTFVKSPVFKWSDIPMMLKSGKANQKLIEFLFEVDLKQESMIYEMPVCLIQGDGDYQTQTTLAVQYFNQLEAPQKQVHIIPEAGHLTMFDQPVLFAEALVKSYEMIAE